MFRAAALQGILAGRDSDRIKWDKAQWACNEADALIEEADRRDAIVRKGNR